MTSSLTHTPHHDIGILLFALEHRLPLLAKRLQRLQPIRRRDDRIIRRVLARLALLPAIDRAHRRRDRQRATGTDIRRHLHRLIEDLLARDARLLGLLLRHLHEPVAEAEEVGLRPGDAAARQDQVARARLADEGRQAVRAAGAG